MNGSYETERQAREAARHITDSPPMAWKDGSHRLLEDACRAAGVQLGIYDQRILLWLADYEPSTCAVIAGLITRAHRGALDSGQAALVLSALEDASEGIRESAANCPACQAHPADLCDEDATRLSRAEAYDHLAAQIRKATAP